MWSPGGIAENLIFDWACKEGVEWMGHGADGRTRTDDGGRCGHAWRKLLNESACQNGLLTICGGRWRWRRSDLGHAQWFVFLPERTLPSHPSARQPFRHKSHDSHHTDGLLFSPNSIAFFAHKFVTHFGLLGRSGGDGGGPVRRSVVNSAL